MTGTANKIIKGIHAKYTGIKLCALADLEIYLNQPVGVGEHSNISEEVEKILYRLKESEEILSVIDTNFPQEEKNE